MTYLLDTDIIVDHLLGAQDVSCLLHVMAEEELAISITTYMEAYEGTYFSENPRLSRDRLRRLAGVMTIVPFAEAEARRCARLRAELRKRDSRVRGRALDVINAAIAIEHRLTLVTRNLDDYEDIPGLRLYRKGGSGA